MKDRAYAKINIALDVFNEREDGYHDIRSIMVPVSFFDEVEMIKADEDSFECNKSYLKFNESNSIYKMLNLVRDKYHIEDKFKITLKKIIPTQAGLAGGTSDAAAVLRILKKMYSLNLGEEEIKELTLAVGADVYFNYFNKPAVVSGIGDELKFIDIKDRYYALIVKPYKGVSTRDAYTMLDMKKCDHPDIDKIEELLINGEDITAKLSNSLEEPSLKLCKGIKNVKEMLLDAGADFALMSGSGSACFTLSKNEKKIRHIYNEIQNSGYFCRFCEVLK